MQEQKGNTSRLKITNRGKETRNSRLNRADRRGLSGDSYLGPLVWP
jgi:hypothetical protein